GGGAFVVAYCRQKLSKSGFAIEEKEKLVHSVYGVDVDPVALVICSYNLWKVLGAPPRHLYFGNPLVKKGGLRQKERLDLFYEGRIYSDCFGLEEGFWENQFDVVLGNPPWEKIRFEERKFFSFASPEIAMESSKKKRAELIRGLKESQPELYSRYVKVKTDYGRFKTNAKNDPRFVRTSVGELNSYALFTELGLGCLSKNGVFAEIVKSSLIKAPVYKDFTHFLVESKVIVSIDAFTNKDKIFPIDGREEFCLLAFGKNARAIKTRVGLTKGIQLLKTPPLEVEADKLFKLTGGIGLIPNISSNDELEKAMEAKTAYPSFCSVFKDVKFGRLVHLTNHGNHLSKLPVEGYLPVWEGKFIGRYNLRKATF
ncbi:MAG: hypothetical protein HUJ63_07830, partial [Enterococcus sp.]|nr:hypothetical protein [Enterococcus sp.]